MAGRFLYQWGIIAFEVYPFNVETVDQLTQTDWARKEIAGAAMYREWVGEGDDEIHLKGKLFPKYFGLMSAQRHSSSRTMSGSGLAHMDLMENMRKLGQTHLLIRGDGHYLGWYAIERLSRGHTHLDERGIGQQIDFEATFQRMPVPDPSTVYSDIWIAGQR